MKKELTQEEKKLKEVVKNEWIEIFNNNNNYNENEVVEGIKWVYTEICNLKEPKVIIVDSIDAAKKEALKYSSSIEPSTYLSYKDAGWLSFYDFFTRIGVVNKDKFNRYRDLMKNGVYYSITLKDVVITSKPPVKVHKSNDNAFHNVNGAAIEFSDGTGVCLVNGREVESELITNGFTKDDFLAEFNEDVKAAMLTIIKDREGNEGLLKFLGAEIIDKKTINHREDYKELVVTFKNKNDEELFNETRLPLSKAKEIFEVTESYVDVKGYSEDVYLYKTKETFDIIDGESFYWVGITCPSTGSTYLIDVPPGFTDAVDALSWTRPFSLPKEMGYRWSSFSN